MWEISKDFNFAAGHRVHNQTLNSEYSLDSQCVCRHLHGHEYKITVHLKSSSLVGGFVTDFKHLNWFKKFLDDVLDHKFIIDRNDPLFDTMLGNSLSLDGYIKFDEGYSIVDMNSSYLSQISEHHYEYFESFVIVDFVPTSENLGKWLYQIAKDKMKKIDVDVSRLELFETAKSRSCYSEG